jgi:ubiquinone/menaquinone biosynthesis C-methylase UbiE
MTTLSLRERYERIAPYYDLLDYPFEQKRYRHIRPQLFAGMGGRILDAGVGTGRNIAYYPQGADVTGVDLSPAMLSRARARAAEAGREVDLRLMDVTKLDLPDDSFDAAVASFLFCVMPDELQPDALREIRRVV